MHIRTFLKPLSFIPALLLMYMIYSFSAQPGDISSRYSYKVSKTIVEAADRLFELGLDDYQVEYYAERIHGLTRKLAHMGEYFLLAIAVSFPLYVYGLHGILLMIIAGAFCIAFACGDEYHQSLIAGRSPSGRDVMIDGIGVFIGIIVVRIIGWTGRMTLFRPLNRKPSKQEKKQMEEVRRREEELEQQRIQLDAERRQLQAERNRMAQQQGAVWASGDRQVPNYPGASYSRQEEQNRQDRNMQQAWPQQEMQARQAHDMQQAWPRQEMQARQDRDMQQAWPQQEMQARQDHDMQQAWPRQAQEINNYQDQNIQSRMEQARQAQLDRERYYQEQGMDPAYTDPDYSVTGQDPAPDELSDDMPLSHLFRSHKKGRKGK